MARGYCVRHYQQWRRGRLGKTKEIAAPGEHAEIVVSLPKAERDRLYAAAEKAGVSGPRYVLNLIRQAR